MLATSSTVPFSHVATTSRCSSSAFGTLDWNATAVFGSAATTAGGILMSMNVRRQSFLQKLQRVASLLVVR